MNWDEQAVSALLAKCPAVRPVFCALAQALLTRFPDTTVTVQRSQIAFQTGGRTYCAFWLPPRAGIKGRPDVYGILTFGLRRRLDSPRIVEAVEPRPNRWTHHMLLSEAEPPDAELSGWLEEARALKLPS